MNSFSASERGLRLTLVAPLLIGALALSGCSSVASLVGGKGPSINVGQCTGPLAGATGGSGDTGAAGDTIDTIDTVPCDQPHNWEAYAQRDITDAEFPGTDALAADAEKFCIGAFEGFVGIAYDDSTVDVQYIFPTEETWKSGSRTINCLVGLEAGRITGTLRDSKK